MNLFDKLKDVLAHKSNSEKAIALLAETLTQTANQFLNYEGIHARSIQKHLDGGKAAFDTASEELKVDDQEESFRTARHGIIHMHIAQLLLSGKYPEKVELNATADSTESVLNDLIKRIAKTKLLVEYGDLLVSVSAQESLLSVLQIFDTSIEDLSKRHLSDARRGASAAHVALHWTLGLIELSNPGQSFSTLKNIGVSSSRHEVMACELADKIVESKIKLNEFLALPEISEHIASAEKRFESCIENIVEGDNQSIVLDCRAGLLDLQLAERASKDNENQPDRRQNQESRQAILEFKQEVQRVLKLVEKIDIDDKALSRRLEAALQYFIEAHKKVSRNELGDAERLGREAHLELDFSWQVANAIKKTEIRERNLNDI
jgi:hypothetical protein